MAPRLAVLRPGIIEYESAYDMQQRIADGVKAGGHNVLIILEHPPTYTLGTRGKRSNILTNDERLSTLGARVVQTDRGGDVTFHGPGQIVGYPIIDLRAQGVGVSDYVRGLEVVLIDTLAQFGITAARSPRNRGVWIGDAKIAAIGVRVSRGVTAHGFALNVNTDLSWFEHIIPCGLTGVRVTSMQEIARRAFDQRAVENEIIDAFSSRFDMLVERPSLAEVAV